MNNTTSYVSSDPLQVCICTNDGLQCGYNHFGELIQTVRGKEFSLQAVVVGQSLGVIPSVVRISLQNGVQVSADQQIQFTGKTCTNVSYCLFAERDYASVCETVSRHWSLQRQ